MAQTVKLSIPDISCHHCVMTIERETKGLPGVVSVKADEKSKTATYTLENDAALKTVKDTLTEIGYPPKN